MTELDYERVARHFLAVHPRRRVRPGPLVEVMRAGRIVDLPAGHVLYREGDEGDVMHFLVSGKVRVERSDLAGGLRVLTTIEAPALVGHMALVDHSRRSATCTVDAAATLIELDRRTYGALLNHVGPAGSAFRRMLLGSLTWQLVAGNRRLETLAPEKPVAAPPPPPAARTAAKERRPATGDELQELGDLLHGWDLSAPELDEMRVVFDEEQKRHHKKRR